MDETNTFSAKIELLGINPFVFLPAKVLQSIFIQAGKDKGTIPVKGAINDNAYKQTLVYYNGAWRLYINTSMLKSSPKRIGETITVTVAFDPEDRRVPMHPKLKAALEQNEKANAVFEKLSASAQKEILRYIYHLKNENSVDRNVSKAVQFLLGEAKFAGRDKPQRKNQEQKDEHSGI